MRIPLGSNAMPSCVSFHSPLAMSRASRCTWASLTLRLVVLALSSQSIAMAGVTSSRVTAGSGPEGASDPLREARRARSAASAASLFFSVNRGAAVVIRWLLRGNG